MNNNLSQKNKNTINILSKASNLIYDESAPTTVNEPNGSEMKALMADVQLALSLADRDGLNRLRKALIQKRVLRGCFEVDKNHGCLVYFALGGVSSHDELEDYSFPTERAEEAVQRVIERWDDHELSEQSVWSALEWAIDERSRANELEDEAVARCKQRCH